MTKNIQGTVYLITAKSHVCIEGVTKTIFYARRKIDNGSYINAGQHICLGHVDDNGCMVELEKWVSRGLTGTLIG